MTSHTHDQRPLAKMPSWAATCADLSHLAQQAQALDAPCVARLMARAINRVELLTLLYQQQGRLLDEVLASAGSDLSAELRFDIQQALEKQRRMEAFS